MPSLSIVIPVLGDVTRLETTLVSVLSHRPASCEVIVVLATSYDDPYDLADEVQFVAARPRAGWVECVNLGFEASRGRVIHVMEAGLEVEEGWANSSVRQFDDPRVAAVAPVVVDACDTKHVWAAGVEYRAGGRRMALVGDEGASAVERWHRGLRGPHRLAGFYRRSVVVDQLGGFDAGAGDHWADAEMAVRLRQAGYTATLEPASRLNGTAEIARDAERARGLLRQGFEAERAFWRNLPARGVVRSLTGHVFSVLGETLRALPNPAAVGGQLAGRLFGLTTSLTQGAYRAHLHAIKDLAADAVTLPAAEHLDRRAALRGERRAGSVASDALRHSA
ncbi:MAG: glycosyltransferase family 2 protein [Pirellulales bacterium]|nr:glycosyltransferase family 2 protein [Pirellulales bacterium]